MPGTRLRRLVSLLARARLLLGVLAVVGGCIAPGAPSPPGDGASTASAPPSTAPAGTTSSAAAIDTPPPIAAARAFLQLTSARFEMAYDRMKPGQPIEREWEVTGVVDPAADRGSLRMLLTPIAPLTPAATLQPLVQIDIVWSATDWWASSPPTVGDEREWKHRSRDGARNDAIVGRVQEEPLALIRLAAEADPTTVEPLAPGAIGGAVADHWLIKVPLDRAKAAYVPPDTYLALRENFGIEWFPLEVWTVNGAIRRVGYVFERKKAPYGGPDRLETYYDWSGFGDTIDLVIPPPGRYVELKP